MINSEKNKAISTNKKPRKSTIIVPGMINKSRSFKVEEPKIITQIICITTRLTSKTVTKICVEATRVGWMNVSAKVTT